MRIWKHDWRMIQRVIQGSEILPPEISCHLYILQLSPQLMKASSKRLRKRYGIPGNPNHVLNKRV